MDDKDMQVEIRKTHIDVLPAMTKREYAAIHIMAGIIEGAIAESPEEVARWAAQAASALFNELEGIESESKSD